MDNNLLEMKKIYKVYPNGVVANRYVDFSLKKGEIHALVGENGAGKSTLMKILFGMEMPSEGEMIFEGEPLVLNSPLDAISRGIGMVHQHFMLVPSLTIAENIVLGMETKKGPFIDRNEMMKRTRELAKHYNFQLNINDKIEDVSVGTKQKVEILKTLYREAKLLILDEPTAVLTPQETEELFSQLKNLREEGHTIIFISHKLNEVKELCDRVTIMRKSENVGVFNVDEVSKEEISNLMIGKEMVMNIDKSSGNVGDILLTVKNAIHINDIEKPVVNDISFQLRSGEILGIVGIQGNGQSELVESIIGYKRLDSGEIYHRDKEITDKSIKEIRNGGISYIPEDRMTLGMASGLSIKENMMSIYMYNKNFSSRGILNNRYINKWTREKIDEFSILASNENAPIGSLSGGNIQKVVVAREFSNNPNLIIADQPTRGIDVGAAGFIHNKLIELRDQGAGILLVSADLNEVLDISDRLIVMYGGKIVACFEDTSKVTEQELGLYMVGIKTQSEEEIMRCFYE